MRDNPQGRKHTLIGEVCGFYLKGNNYKGCRKPRTMYGLLNVGITLGITIQKKIVVRHYYY